jgi:hypothetical protein
MLPTYAGKSLGLVTGLDPATYLPMKNAKRQPMGGQVQCA